MRLTLFQVFVLICISSSALAQNIPTPSGPSAIRTKEGVDPAKKALILKFLEVFGTRKALADNLDRVVRQIPAGNAKDAAKIRDRIKVDEIIEELVPVYDRSFTSEELKAYIDFYDSPDGRKLLAKIPMVLQKSVEISSKYMEKKFPEMK